MNLKLRLQDKKNISKTEVDVVVERISYKNNLINSKDAKVKLFFRKDSATGILELSMGELERIRQKVREEKALKHSTKEQVQAEYSDTNT